MKGCLGAPLQGRRLSLPTDIKLGWKYLPGTNAPDYYKNLSNMAVKYFITLGPEMPF